MIRIEPTTGKDKNTENLSTMSRFIKYLVLIKFVPIQHDQENSKPIFKLFSLTTLAYIMIFLGVPSISALFDRIFFKEVHQLLLEMIRNANIIDKISIIGFSLVNIITCPICPLLLAKAIPSIPLLTMDRDLKWPKNGLGFVISSILIFFGYWVAQVSLMLDATEGKNVKKSSLIFSSTLQMTQVFVLACFWVIPPLIFSSWIDKLIWLCNKKSSSNILQHTKFCLNLFSDIKNGFGVFFLYVFGVSQFSSILSFFVVLSWPMSPDGFILTRFVYSVGLLSSSSGLIVNIVTITWKLDCGYQAMRGMTRPLQEILVTVQEDKYLRQEAKNMMCDIRNTGPFSGKGLFSITRGTLTGMLSIGVTYVIILVQFKMTV